MSRKTAISGKGVLEHVSTWHLTVHNLEKILKPTKAWLFEWCTQKKMKPTYSFESKGKYPKVKYICTLSIDGIEYRAISEARNKKDAQVNTSGARDAFFSPAFFTLF